MPNLNPYVKTVKTYTAEDIAGWEVKTFPDDPSVTAELRGRSFLVSPVQTKPGYEQNHHEVEIGIEGDETRRVNIHMGHAHNDTLFDRVVSTYHYSIDWKDRKTATVLWLQILINKRPDQTGFHQFIALEEDEMRFII